MTKFLKIFYLTLHVVYGFVFAAVLMLLTDYQITTRLVSGVLVIAAVVLIVVIASVHMQHLVYNIYRAGVVCVLVSLACTLTLYWVKIDVKQLQGFGLVDVATPFRMIGIVLYVTNIGYWLYEVEL